MFQYDLRVGHLRDKQIIDCKFYSVAIWIFIWKMFFMWRNSANQFYQDESGWADLAGNLDLFHYSMIPDSGYPTPILRIGFWILTRLVTNNALAVHAVGAVIASLCCASILKLSPKNIPTGVRVPIALALGSFASFDLLLWFNLSYYLFIPGLFIIEKFCLEYRNPNKKYLYLTLLSILAVAKPQLIASFLLMLLLIFWQAGGKRIPVVFYFPILIIISFLVFGRLQSNSLPLSLDPKHILFALISVIVMPAVVLFPLYSIGITGFLRLKQLDDIFLIAQIVNVILGASLVFTTLKKYLTSKIHFLPLPSRFITFSFIPVYLSLFIFPNSGWSFDFFWQNTCTVCLFQRHIFPVFSIALLISAYLQKNFRFGYFFIVSISAQFIFLSAMAYSYLYSPV